MEKRNYRFDNIKAILIIFVIFAHMLELFKTGNNVLSKTYLVIYSFHMPLFIFVTGFFAKFSKKKIGILIFTYAIFQFLYRGLDLLLFNNGSKLIFNYVTPYWLLWYIFTIALYTLLIPLIETDKKVDKIIIISVVFVLSMIVNFASNIGYYASISRFFTFLPYFVLGYYSKDFINKIDEKTSKLSTKTMVIAILSVLAILSIVLTKINSRMVWGSYSYADGEYGILYKLLLFLIACVWIGLIYFIVPNKNIKCFTLVGKNTFTVYLFHGFIVLLLKKYEFFNFDLAINTLLAFVFSIVITYIFSNKYIAKALRFVFCGEFLLAIYKKANKDN